MTTQVIKEGNVTTTILDLTNGVGGRSAEEILALTGGGKTREYTETRPDGSTVTYTIDVEEEIIEVTDKKIKSTHLNLTRNSSCKNS